MSTRRAVLASTDYEPYDNRVKEQGTNGVEALVHLVKGILGTGILAMPEAFKNSGYIIGVVGNVVITFLITYCLHLLFQGMYFFCKRDKVAQVNYPDTLKEALKIGPECMRKCSDAAPFVLNFFIILYQLGIMSVYLAFCGTNLKQVVDYYTTTASHLSTEVYQIMLIIPFIMISYIKNLKWLAPFSQVANWVTLIALVALHYYFFESIEPFTERAFFAHIKYYPLFLGTTMFSVLAIGAILSIEGNMKNGRLWLRPCGILNLGMIIVTALNIFTGFFGYWRYGDEIMPVVTLNIDISQILAQIIRLLFCLAIYISYALQAYPVTEILWEQYAEKYMKTCKHPMLYEYIIRTILVLASFVLAVYVPELGLIISLFGAFCLSVLGIILPPIIDICIRWPDDLGKGKLILLRDILLIIFGFLGWVFGTYSALRGIIESLVSKAKK